MIQASLQLARTNCQLLYQQFGQTYTLDSCFQDQTNSHQQIKVNHNMVVMLYKYLVQTNKIINKYFHNVDNMPNEYSFLVSCWQKHSERLNQQNNSTADRIDSLNQVISKLKYRSKQLMVKEVHQNKRFWSQSIMQNQKYRQWDHPYFEIMNNKITILSMQNSQYEQKISTLKTQSAELLNKNKQMEVKYNMCKEKNKKMQGKMFQLAKKKAELQKQIFEKVYSKVSVKDNKIANKENQSNNITAKLSQFVPLLQEQCKSKTKLQKSCVGLPGTLCDKNIIQQKYRNAKLVSRRSISNVSLNSSFDSVKSIKFERTGGKKLLIKQKE